MRAMIENAKESSWQENLANALDAHERFVLPGQQGQAQPEFVDKIVERSDRMIEEQRHRQREKERKRQEAGGGHEKFLDLDELVVSIRTALIRDTRGRRRSKIDLTISGYWTSSTL